MIKFEKISKYADVDISLPTRATKDSAGYDFYVAEDVIILPYEINSINLLKEDNKNPKDFYTLDEIADLTKTAHARPTLVSTGVKCYLEPNTYLELVMRSSVPLKSLLVLANGQGIIDSDYVDNPDTEGCIYFQILNLSPVPIKLKRGDRIGQGIIHHYLKTDDDNAEGVRVGGFGST